MKETGPHAGFGLNLLETPLCSHSQQRKTRSGGEGVRVLVKNCERSEQMVFPTVNKYSSTCFLEEISLLAPWCSIGMSQRQLCA